MTTTTTVYEIQQRHLGEATGGAAPSREWQDAPGVYHNDKIRAPGDAETAKRIADMANIRADLRKDQWEYRAIKRVVITEETPL